MSKKLYTGKQTTDYEFSIPERSQILDYLREANKPRTLKHIADALGADSAGQKSALKNRLKAMLRDGEVIKNRRDGYGLTEKMDLLAGTVIAHPDGYGFLRPDRGAPDLFLPAREMQSLMHGDRVLVRISGTSRRNQQEGALVEILEHANRKIVGRYFREGQIGYVAPDNPRLHQDVLIPAGREGKARAGEYVVAGITKFPDRHTQPVGKVIEILRQETYVEMATEVAIRAHDIPWQWPDEITPELEVIASAADRVSGRRTDLRGLPFITIDGEDARDFDDAVCGEETEVGWKLFVAIADVSGYVLPGSALDIEAENRGTSVYFPQRVVPMLPELLSNDLCSLKPAVDRPCLVCEMEISRQGLVENSRFLQALIHSRRRMTYTEMAAVVVEKNDSIRRSMEPLIEHLDLLYRLFKLMHGARTRQGLLEFGTTETRMEFDKKGRIRSISPLLRNDAHRLIEEFMLAANVAAAELLQGNEIPILYRNHEPPNPEKLADLREFLAGFGLQLGGGEKPGVNDYAVVLDTVRDREYAHLVETVLLRSMSLAVYEAVNKGHFGLAFESYTHFTSPIRRYPDLLVHRAIRHLINAAPYGYSMQEMQNLGLHCSQTERRADDATRDVAQRLKCEFMQDRIGEIFSGTISGVTAFGLFVELDEALVEGLVHVTALPNDYYHFDAAAHCLRGERSGRSFSLAGRIQVMVTRVDIDEKKIDLEFLDGRESRK